MNRLLVLSLFLVVIPPVSVLADRSPDPGESRVGHPTFLSPHASPIVVGGERVYAVNTPADTVDVIDASSAKILARIAVGIDPVSLALRPDGRELWVSCHVSDSVNVIDLDPRSPTRLRVVATIQELDPETGSTRFDEPVGIAFAGNEKAYVALSSENEIAVVDARTRSITRRLSIPAQDPRALAVRGERLYVLPFESGNRTQLSGGVGELDGDLTTFDAHEHSIRHNNVLSLGHVVDIVRHPRVPDRDLFVFDTRTDELLDVVDGVGTLLYGLTVDSRGRVFVAQAEARNDANGRAGTRKHGLEELENRAFLNRITRVSPRNEGQSEVSFIELEPLPPRHPERDQALATPFAIEVSGDDSILVATAAGSDRLFTVEASSGKVLGRVGVGAVPRGVALESSPGGAPARAWVLEAVGNSVSRVELSDPARPRLSATTQLEDPTHPEVRRGRIAFNSAAASSTGTFSCASCHPDGHTDQLLWVLKTPVVSGGDQIMPRSTMPARGLRDTAPFHWDGIPGDPYGGNNSASVRGSDPPNVSGDDPAAAPRHLIDGGLASTMLRLGDPTLNDEGKPGYLSAADRDALATFLLAAPYPPAPKRALDDRLSDRAKAGFRLFHVDGDHDGKPRPNVCGNCHRMPFWVSTNTPGTGMDAPTWRGAQDRFLILPQGRLNIIDFDFYRRLAERGAPEREIWRLSWGGRRRFDPVWDMVLEGSTGFSGALGRQVSLGPESAGNSRDADLLAALEQAAIRGAIVLEGEGIWLGEGGPRPLSLRFENTDRGWAHVERPGERELTGEELIRRAVAGSFVGTFTARHGPGATVEHPQPALWTRGPIEAQRGRQEFPILHGDRRTLSISGRHVRDDALVLIDGRPVEGVIRRGAGEDLDIILDELPRPGLRFLQVQNPGSFFSNEFLVHVAESEAAARQLVERLERRHRDSRDALARAISSGDLSEVRKIFARGASRHSRHPRSGATPISDAAFHGHLDIVDELLRRGTRVGVTNRDGNTPLHVAAFLGRFQIVERLLERGASPHVKNDRGETPLDVVESPWADDLANFYRRLDRDADLGLDLDGIRRDRPEMARWLRGKLRRF